MVLDNKGFKLDNLDIGKRYYHTSTIFNNSIYIIGGKQVLEEPISNLSDSVTNSNIIYSSSSNSPAINCFNNIYFTS